MQIGKPGQEIRTEVGAEQEWNCM